MCLRFLKRFRSNACIKWGCGLLVLIALFRISLTWAAGDVSLSSWADTLKSTYQSLTRIITGAAYAGGCAFATMSVLKFKAHKDNPTQIPLSTPIALMFIGGALMFLPYIFSLAGGAVFGSQATRSDFSGVSDIPGYNS